MAKRKRNEATNGEVRFKEEKSKKPRANAEKTDAHTNSPEDSSPLVIQIIAGSYDRILHGVTATIDAKGSVEFADTFLFNAHTSAIRCLALSDPSPPTPGQGQKVFLASGSTDERINVYNLSAHPPNRSKSDALAGVTPRPVLENSRNREVGTLLHHSSSVTRLCFPTRSKLLSASEDSTIMVTRTRDWQALSSIKAPIAKPMGRPTGDTAPFGGTPSGVNDFAVHPSMKVMISVSKGERCMRLWNLVTGKKGGVLNFGREILQEVGEGKHSTGEARRVVWGPGEEFAVAFDRDVVVFGADSLPRCRIMGKIRTKVHEVAYLATSEDGPRLLTVSTEDGRILFFSTREEDLTTPEPPAAPTKSKSAPLRVAKLVAYMGGKDANVKGRVKDFAAVRVSRSGKEWIYFATGGSDGKMGVWRVSVDTLVKAADEDEKDEKDKRVGEILGTYDTMNRITCVEGFAMIPRPDGVEDSDEGEDWEDDDEGGGDEEDEDEDDDEDDEE